jgi:hypothetical protein
MIDFSTTFYAGRNRYAIAISKQISVDGRKAGVAVSTTDGHPVHPLDPAL